MRTLPAIVILTLTIAACGTTNQTTDGNSDDGSDPQIVAVAARLCPVMWRWQLDVGSTMNHMSDRAYVEESSVARTAIYRNAFEGIRTLNAGLVTEVRSLTGTPLADALISDILDGIALADSIVDELEADLPDIPATYHDAVPVIFLTVEKVIDVAKPELATYPDAALIPSFMTVPQCQFGVKDADDGVPRYVPVG